MKKFLILFLICGLSISSFGQVVSNYTIILNNDSSILNATLENKKIVFDFQKTDVLAIIFKEIESDLSKKSVEIISDSNSNEILIETFEKNDINGDNSFTLKISFSKLQNKLQSESNNIYTIIIKDDIGKQNLLRFRLI